MGLSSVFSTAVTGLTAAETTIDVVGNNIANSNTIGFKSSSASFSTQFLQTLGLGAAPSETNGGVNPRQIGLGTQVASINPDFTPGTLEISSSSSDLAIQGDGFFIVESNGAQLYTRNGKFQVNSENQLVTVNGDRLVGFGVNDNYEIERTLLTPIEIPLGAAAVAKATQNVTMEGTLTPTGDLASTAGILDSAILGTSARSAPSNSTDINLSANPVTTTTTLTGGAGGALAATGTYQYRVVFADGPLSAVPPGTESNPSAAIGPITLGAGQQQVTLGNIPTDSSGLYSTRRIYRTENGGTDFKLVAEIPDNTATSFVDGVADGALSANLNTNSISGNYSYYVTFATAAGGPGVGEESRPSPLIGPRNVVNGRIQLSDLPVDTSGDWNVRRIYRNLSTDDSKFYFVGEIPNNTAGVSFTDNISDSTIVTNAEIDRDGPRITPNTRLVDVLRRTDNVFQNVFQEGTLSLASRKGGRQLTAKTLEITDQTTVLDLIKFVEDASGIQRAPGPDSNNPIPPDSTGANPGGAVTVDGQLRFISNNGVANAVEIPLSGFQLTTTAGTTQINLGFGTTQEAVGESAVADFIVYDSLGIPLNVRVTTVLESRSDTETVFRWYADAANNSSTNGVGIAVGTGLIRFDGDGRLITADNDVAIQRDGVPSVSPLEFQMDFSRLSGLAAEKSTMSATRQDGFAPGKLSSFIIGDDGTIRGVFDNGTQRDLGQIRLARFANPQGLIQKGQNLYAAGSNSGLPIEGDPNQQGIGSIISGAVELSNTDIGENLIDLILASTAYRGNSRVITAAQQLLDELLNLRR